MFGACKPIMNITGKTLLLKKRTIWNSKFYSTKFSALTGFHQDAPSSLLSSKSGQLSVHQRTALFTLRSVHKALGTKQPAYSYSAFKPTAAPGQPARLQSNWSKVNYKLSISRGSYLYRGSRLYNQLPDSLVKIRKKLNSRKVLSNGSKNISHSFLPNTLWDASKIVYYCNLSAGRIAVLLKLDTINRLIDWLNDKTIQNQFKIY